MEKKNVYRIDYLTGSEPDYIVADTVTNVMNKLQATFPDDNRVRFISSILLVGENVIY